MITVDVLLYNVGSDYHYSPFEGNLTVAKLCRIDKLNVLLPYSDREIEQDDTLSVKKFLVKDNIPLILAPDRLKMWCEGYDSRIKITSCLYIESDWDRKMLQFVILDGKNKQNTISQLDKAGYRYTHEGTPTYEILRDKSIKVDKALLHGKEKVKVKVEVKLIFSRAVNAILVDYWDNDFLFYHENPLEDYFAVRLYRMQLVKVILELRAKQKYPKVVTRSILLALLVDGFSACGLGFWIDDDDIDAFLDHLSPEKISRHLKKYQVYLPGYREKLEIEKMLGGGKDYTFQDIKISNKYSSIKARCTRREISAYNSKAMIHGLSYRSKFPEGQQAHYEQLLIEFCQEVVDTVNKMNRL